MRKRLDLDRLYRFFFGRIGWTPRTVRQEAQLNDLLQACLGYFEAKAPQKGEMPAKRFLEDMARIFPDGEKQ